MSRAPVAVVLAAGKGTRMRSARPKVLHEAGGRPLLGWAIAAARQAGCARIVVVVGHQSERVRAAFPDPDLVFVEQAEQLGTGHALLQAAAAIDGEATVLVLSGDAPLVRAATLERLLAAAGGRFGALAVAELAEPGALGRVLTRPEGTLERIVEAVDATPEERAVRTVNAGFYALPAPQIFGYLRALRPENAKGELYLTDALGAAVADGHALALVTLADPAEAWGINDRRELERAHRRLVERKLDELMLAGVTILAPTTTTIDADVAIGEDSVVHAGVALLGNSVVGRGVALHQGAWLRDCRLGDDVVIEPYSVLDRAVVEGGARIGPFARLRPGATIGEGARVGNFVEIKNSRLGAGAKANHLAYVGDAEVGARANIGAGVVTCNYDGVAKHRTEIGAGAFVGSDTMLVAPVRVGEEATTAAGSVITQDVPDGALGVERTRQKNVPGWAARRKRRRASEE